MADVSADRPKSGGSELGFWLRIVLLFAIGAGSIYVGAARPYDAIPSLLALGVAFAAWVSIDPVPHLAPPRAGQAQLGAARSRVSAPVQEPPQCDAPALDTP
jgi:hypothetical protein